MSTALVSKANLVRRGISMVNSICGLCGKEEETMSHLFCTYRVVWLVCSKYYDGWGGIDGALQVKNMNKSVNQIWGCVWVAMVAKL